MTLGVKNELPVDLRSEAENMSLSTIYIFFSFVVEVSVKLEIQEIILDLQIPHSSTVI